MNELTEYLNSKYKNKNDYVIIENNIYSKTAVSFQTLNYINKIRGIKAVFYLTEKSVPYQKGYRLGICLT